MMAEVKCWMVGFFSVAYFRAGNQPTIPILLRLLLCLLQAWPRGENISIKSLSSLAPACQTFGNLPPISDPILIN